MFAQSRCLPFNSLHDLDQDGFLSIPELEAVYGLHHPQAKKSTPDAHMEAKRRAIMDKVLRQLDTNKDGESERSEGSQRIPTPTGFLQALSRKRNSWQRALMACHLSLRTKILDTITMRSQSTFCITRNCITARPRRRRMKAITIRKVSFSPGLAFGER